MSSGRTQQLPCDVGDRSVGWLAGVYSPWLHQSWTTAQRISGPVRRQIEMKVRHVIAKDVAVGLLRSRRVPQCRRDPREDGSEGRGFWPVQVGDERDVAFRLQVRETRNGAAEHCRQPPQVVLPDPHPGELPVCISRIAQQASVHRPKLPWRVVIVNVNDAILAHCTEWHGLGMFTDSVDNRDGGRRKGAAGLTVQADRGQPDKGIRRPVEQQ